MSSFHHSVHFFFFVVVVAFHRLTPGPTAIFMVQINMADLHRCTLYVISFRKYLSRCSRFAHKFFRFCRRCSAFLMTQHGIRRSDILLTNSCNTMQFVCVNHNSFQFITLFLAVCVSREMKCEHQVHENMNYVCCICQADGTHSYSMHKFFKFFMMTNLYEFSLPLHLLLFLLIFLEFMVHDFTRHIV